MPDTTSESVSPDLVGNISFAVYLHRQQHLRLHELAADGIELPFAPSRQVQTIWVDRLFYRPWVRMQSSPWTQTAPITRVPTEPMSVAAWQAEGFVPVGVLTLPADQVYREIKRWVQAVVVGVDAGLQPIIKWPEQWGNETVTYCVAQALCHLQGHPLKFPLWMWQPPALTPDQLRQLSGGPALPADYPGPEMVAPIVRAVAETMVPRSKLYAHPSGALRIVCIHDDGKTVSWQLTNEYGEFPTQWENRRFVTGLEALPDEFSPDQLVAEGYQPMGELLVPTRGKHRERFLPELIHRIDHFLAARQWDEKSRPRYTVETRDTEARVGRFLAAHLAHAHDPLPPDTTVVPPPPDLPDIDLSPDRPETGPTHRFMAFAHPNGGLRLHHEALEPGVVGIVYLQRANPLRSWRGLLHCRKENERPPQLLVPNFTPEEWVRAGYTPMGVLQAPNTNGAQRRFLIKLWPRLQEAVITGMWPEYERPPLADPNRRIELQLVNFWRQARGEAPLTTPLSPLSQASRAAVIARQWDGPCYFNF